jgi:prophage antirepressor-like protein
MNSASMQCYGFDDQLVRVVMKDGEPWFVAIDICRVLGIKDVSQAVEKLDDDEKGTYSIRTLGGDQESWIVSESGLYTLILRSRAATTPGSPAHRFRKWVTGEVIPSIRKTGGYGAVDDDEKGISSTDTLGDDFPSISLAEERLKLEKVHQCRQLYGSNAARALWVALGLELVDGMLAKERPSQRVDMHQHVSDFVAERVDVVPGLIVPASVLYSAYVQWCDGKALSPVATKPFSRSIRDLGFERRKSSGMYYVGLRLRPL